ncbi:MAG: hypothetical protein WBO76_18010, partial [Saprospiraceae bacterium]
MNIYKYCILLLLLLNCKQKPIPLDTYSLDHTLGILIKSGQEAMIDSMKLIKTPIDSQWLNFGNYILSSKINHSNDSTLLILANIFHDLGSKKIDSNIMVSKIFFKSALKLRKIFYNNEIQLDILRSLINIGDLYGREENHFEALKYYNEADVKSDAFQIFPYIYNQSKKGESYYKLKDYNESINCLELGRKRINEYTSELLKIDNIAWFKAITKIYYLYTLESNSYRATRQYYKAIYACKEGINFVHKWVDKSDSIEQLANLYISLGNAYQDSASIISSVETKNSLYYYAIENYKNAQINYAKVNKLDEVSICVGNISSMYNKLELYNKSQEIISDLLTLIKENNYVLSKNQNLILKINLGSSLFHQKKFANALQSFLEAMSLAHDSYPKNNTIPNVSSLYLQFESSLQLLFNLGGTYIKMAENDYVYIHNATACYDSLFQLINYIRGNLLIDQAKINLAEQAREWVPDAFSDIKELYQITKDSFYKERAFQIVEQAKAFSLLEASRLNNASELLPK